MDSRRDPRVGTLFDRHRLAVAPYVARPRFLVGAAIGTGMAAQSAMRGGADFLLALSAGRIRCMGEPSIAGMLPLRDSNALVMGFARSEILPRATVPVFFGAASFDPRIDLERLVDDVAAAGFAGLANFPTAVLIDGAYRRFLEEEGIGFNRELELLELARKRGLATLAYTCVIDEARAAAERGIDIVNIDLGWNMGGVLGVDTDVRIDEAALKANTIAATVRSIAPDTLCVVEGGPIVSPRQLEELCQIARVDGYVGGSTIDRVPSESAMEVVTAAFKAIGALNRRIDGLDRGFARSSLPRALWGRSDGAETARGMFARLANTDHPACIVGEPGTGRREIALALHSLSSRKSRNLVTVPCRGVAADRLRLELFGCMAGAHPSIAKHRLGWLEAARGSTILLEEADQLDLELQRLVFEAVERGRFWRIGGAEPIDLDVRILATSSRDPYDPGGRTFHPGFAERIGCFTIVVPALRERLDDLPSLIDETLSLIQSRSGGARKRLDAAAYRALVDHRWPGNLRELTTALECASLVSAGDVIGLEHLPPLRDAGGSARGQLSALRSEKEWLLDGLRRNRFRRGRTADYVGISRKTLYNKMRAQGLLPGALDERTPAPKARGPSAERPEAGHAES